MLTHQEVSLHAAVNRDCDAQAHGPGHLGSLPGQALGGVVDEDDDGHQENIDISQSPGLRGFRRKPLRCSARELAIYAVLLGEVNHRLDIFRLCMVKERPIAQDKTTAFAGSIDEFLGVISYLIGCA